MELRWKTQHAMKFRNYRSFAPLMAFHRALSTVSVAGITAPSWKPSWAGLLNVWKTIHDTCMQISFYTITRFFEDNFYGKIRQDVAWTTSSLNNFKGDTGRSYIRNPEVVLRSNDSRRVRPRGRFWSVIIDCKQVLQPRWKRLQKSRMMARTRYTMLRQLATGGHDPASIVHDRGPSLQTHI